MGAALLDGFERGFNMMERHDARVGRKERLSRMDEQNESRYQDGQTRLADMDKQNKIRYDDNQARQVTNDKNTADYRTSMLNSNQERTENQQKHYKWQQNVKDREQKWSLIAPQLENIHNQFFETGTMPEQAEQFFKDTPLYNDYNPATYTDKKRRDSIKQLEAKTKGALDSGNFAVFKEPEFLKLFNTSYQSTIKRGVGDFDDKEGATIVDKELYRLIPAGEGSVSIELNVTYQKPNGDKYTKPQPMTKGGTNEEEDPVNRWSLGEMMNTMKVRSSMADLAENGEKYRARSQQTLGAMKGPDKNPDWKEVKGDMGQTLGYQNLNNGQFQQLAGGAEEAGMNVEEKANNKQKVAVEQTNTFISAAGGMSKDLGLDLNDDDIATVVQMFETQARQSGGKADLNKLMVDMLKNHAKTKAENTKQKAEQRTARKAHIAENPDTSKLSFK